MPFLHFVNRFLCVCVWGGGARDDKEPVLKFLNPTTARFLSIYLQPCRSITHSQKDTLNPSSLSNCHPTSFLPFAFKLSECTAYSCCLDVLSSNSSLELLQIWIPVPCIPLNLLAPKSLMTSLSTKSKGLYSVFRTP